MAAKPNPIDKPTRGTIESLFKELLNCVEQSSPLYFKYEEARRKEDELEEKLLASPELQRLKRLKERAYNDSYLDAKERKARIIALRNRYLARGITSNLLSAIDKLLAELK